MLESSDINGITPTIQPIELIDEASLTEYYFGVSINGPSKNSPNWRIKRVIKIGNVWHTQYPNGNQNYTFVWDDRYTYDYKL